jgi:hypothetical protein
VSPEDENFESLLRQALSQSDLPDGGFTAGVLVRLPKAGAMSHYRAWRLLGWIGTVTGACLGLWACVPWSALTDASSTLGGSAPSLSAYAWTSFAFFMTLASSLVGWYVVASAREA